MAQVIEGGEFGVAFEGEELRDLLKLVEFAIVTTENVGVPVWELGEWKTALEEALTAPRDEEEVEEEREHKNTIPLTTTGSTEPCATCGREFKYHTYAGNEGKWARWKCPAQATMWRSSIAPYPGYGAMEVLPPEGGNAGKAPVRARRREE